MERKVYENPVYGDRAIFLATSGETNGQRTVIELEVVPGGGNQPHLHDDCAETFTVLEGDLTLLAGKEYKTVQRGETFTAPPKMIHCFKNRSDRKVKFIVEMTPGQPGFERVLKIGYGLAKDGLTNRKGVPNKFSHFALLIVMSAVRLPGIFMLLMPAFRWSADRAIKNGEAAKLIHKYCG
jgi:mannose-6-phosphate isomerase-like protein (cupin superfamily)